MSTGLGFNLPNLPLPNTPSLNFQLPGLHLPNFPALPFLHPAEIAYRDGWPVKDPPPRGLTSNSPLPATYANIWGIYDASGKKLFDVDTCLEVDFKDDSKVSDFPQEQGSFSSYNKVKLPLEAKVKLAVGGQVRINALIVALRAAINSISVYDVWTPEYIYQNCTIKSGNYKRTQKDGRNLLEVLIDLKEIREVSPQYGTTVPITAKKASKPSSVSKTSSGKVQTSTPAPSLQNLTTAQAIELGRQKAAQAFGR